MGVAFIVEAVLRCRDFFIVHQHFDRGEARAKTPTVLRNQITDGAGVDAHWYARTGPNDAAQDAGTNS